MRELAKALKGSFRFFKTNFLKLIPVFAIDFAFFLGFVLAFTSLAYRLSEKMRMLYSSMAASGIEGFDPNNSESIRQLISSQTQLAAAAKEVIYVMLAMIAVFFVLYVATQSIAFKRIYSLMKIKLSYLEVLKRFTVINLVWLVLTMLAALYVGTSIGTSYADILLMPLFKAVQVLLIILVAYLTYAAYAAMPKYDLNKLFRNILRIGWKGAGVLLPSLLLCIALIYVLFALMKYISDYSALLALLFFIVVMLPAFAWIKVFTTELRETV